MNFQEMTLKVKIIMAMIPTLIVMVVVGMFTINAITKHSLDLSLASSLKSLGNIAAETVKTGLEFEDEETIKDSVKPLITDEQIASLLVLDASGSRLFYYRKQGYQEGDFKNDAGWKNFKHEIFTKTEVLSSGAPIGVVVLSITLEARDAALAYSFRILLILTVVGLSILTWVILLLSKKITDPIIKIADIARYISEGDLSREVDISSHDEIGQLADSFKQLILYIRGLAEAADNLSSGDLTQQINVRSNADVLSVSFKNLSENLNKIFGNLTAYSDELNIASGQLDSASQEMSSESSVLSQKTGIVAASAEQLNSSIITISNNAEELTSTVDEIAQNAEKARVVTNEAVKNTQDISFSMETLNSAANEISNVIQVIFDIADQTKLLALNATIEAARAGEAGKGFAVVANEVKELAAQTNSATDEIREKITAMQQSTKDVISKTEQINKITTDVNEIVVTIATAVEEQNVTTKDIADNINQTATVSQSISNDMSAFSASSAKVNDVSSNVNTNATGLLSISKEMQAIVRNFKL